MSNDKYRVLILDDDEELGELLKEFLQNTTQCAVTYINSENEFWERIRLEPFDILFLDYKLPDTNGLEILSRLVQQGFTIPTVMMTGEGSENIAARAIQSGALDYLVKGEYSFSALPPLIQKAARLREMQNAMQLYLEQIRYQSMLLDNMRDAVVVWGLNGDITYWNAAAEQLYGSPASECLGKNVVVTYFSRFDPPISEIELKRAGNIQLEHRYQLPDGIKIWVSTHITALYSESSRSSLIGYMNVARDITPRRQEQEALLKSQNFIKRILDTSPNIVYIMDLVNQQFQYVNAEVKNILGYQIDEFTPVPFETIHTKVHPKDFPIILNHLQALQSMQDGDVLEIEFRFITQENEWRWLKSRDAVFSTREDGSPAEIIGVVQDITASKLAESQLQHRLDSEKLISTISSQFINLSRNDTDREIASVMQKITQFIQMEFGAIWLTSSSGLARYTHFSINDYEEDEDFNLDELNRYTASWLMSKLHSHQVTILNMQKQHQSGTEQDHLVLEAIGLRSLILAPMTYQNMLHGTLVFGTKKQALDWKEDDIYVLQTFGELITNALVKKQIDQALRKSEARYRAIVEDHQTEMICRFLPNTSLTFVNEAYCRYYGKDRSWLINTSFLNPIWDEDRSSVREKLAGLSTSSPVTVFEQRVELPGTETKWQEWVARAIFDSHNDFIEFQAVGRDITERKMMEAQIKAAQTRLAQAARLASIGELASGVAHQISNPLTTIIADAQILLHQLDKHHPGRESAEAIIEAGWRTQQVVNGLMRFSQPTKATFELIEVNETIEAALLLAKAHIQAYSVNLHIDLATALPHISGNPRQLTDLWVNLLLLARSSFKDGKEHNIWISTCSNSKNELQVEIADDGIPISVEQYDKIFEPQLIPNGMGRGTGIELSICHELVRQNRGKIDVESDAKRTTFRILFPAKGM